MKKMFLMLVLLITGVFSSVAQKEVSGVKVSDKLTFQGKDFVLNGVGVREKYWIDLYVGSLYLPKKTSDAKTVINSTDGAIINLNIVSGMITSEKMMTAVNEGFEKSLNGKTEPMKDKIAKFESFFKEKINKGDQFIIANLPNEGVTVYKNGVKVGVIEGHDFKKALFGIWLSDKPADKDLKAAMLGL